MAEGTGRSERGDGAEGVGWVIGLWREQDEGFRLGGKMGSEKVRN